MNLNNYLCGRIMKISRKILYILSTLLLVCCNASREFDVSDFGESLSLQGHGYDLGQGVEVMDVWGVADSLVVVNIKGGIDHNYVVARLSDCSEKSKIHGMKGDSHIVKNREELMFFDPIPGRISILNQQGEMQGKMWDISGVDIARDIVYEEPVFVYANFDSSFKKNIIKLKDKERSVLSDFSAVLKQIPDQNICQGFIGLNSTSQRVVFAYKYLKRFEIYDSEGELIAALQDPVAEQPSMADGGVDRRLSTIHYNGISTTADRIYLYYVGLSEAELSQRGEVKTFVEEFDWDGNPICRYEIGDYLSHFDYMNGVFMGSTPQAEQPFGVYKKGEI